ncbi:hypothetical protein [Sediminibacillus albus]|uniref:YfhE-like protein n=1 Tax=Sediminibacillus albus TaxID=407036 RepID=A0A1G8Y3H2_9BACI|nr:hypothetical protein [Sediminibacillus albus]SDJ96984.1 hypothetical protein SAMN05216243_1368 [Sediminibacillus albus]
MDRAKDPNNMKREKKDNPVAEQQLTYPGQEADDFRDITYTPGENHYLNEPRGKKEE